MSTVMLNSLTADGHPAPPVSVIAPLVANQAPPGTKLWILNLGTLEADEGMILRGANGGTRSNPNPVNKRRKLAMIAALIEHPVEGLILWETGPGPGQGGDNDYEKMWGDTICDIFPRVDAKLEDDLDVAIAKTGHDIKDVKHVIMGHLHIDHAGGLLFFKGRTDVTIWVHDVELKYAFWGMATKAEWGLYLPQYMDLNLNWRTVNTATTDLFSGLSVFHSPGHTPGLMCLQVNLAKDGPFIFTSDHFHIRENYETGVIQGWLARDAEAWYHSTENIRRRHRATNARIVYGHDYSTCEALLKEKPYFE